MSSVAIESPFHFSVFISRLDNSRHPRIRKRIDINSSPPSVYLATNKQLLLLFNRLLSTIKMQVTTLLSLALCAFVSAAPLQKPHAARLVPPDASLVFAEISAISGDVSTLNSEVNAYNGTTSTTLVSHFEYLVNSLKTATVDTSSSAPFTETESESISNAISALSSSAISLLQDLDAKVSPLFPDLSPGVNEEGRMLICRSGGYCRCCW